MNDKPTGSTSIRTWFVETALGLLFATSGALGAQSPVNLGTAGNYAILAKSGISTVPTTAVTGNMGVSPIDSSAITGFSLIMDSSGQFSTSAQVTGKVYGADYASPTPANLTTAIGDMQTAYTTTAGLTDPDYTELGSGNIGGLTLAPGLYKWSTSVSIPANVTLSGGPGAVWIFQIAGNLNLSSATAVILSGGAQAQNVFWQVGGGVGVALGSTSRFEGTIMAVAGISLQTGAEVDGRLLAQTAVTLQANTITVPPFLEPPSFGPIVRTNGSVILVITNSPGYTFTLQSSTNLLTWITLSTLTPTNSPYVLTNTSAAGDAAIFYRAFYP